MRIVAIIFLLAFLACNRSTIDIIQPHTHDIETVRFVQTNEVKLSPPIIEFDSILFVHSAIVDLAFSLDHCTILYSLNEGQFQNYTKPIHLTKSTTVYAFVKKDGFISSDTISVSLARINNSIKEASIVIDPTPHSNYPGEGPQSMVDLKKGSLNFRDGKLWSGFQSKQVKFSMSFEKNESIEEVTLSLLSDHGSWIFEPSKIEVLHSGKSVGHIILDFPETECNPNLSFITVPVFPSEYKELNIIIYNLDGIPDWHPGKGTIPWLFIDEILFN